MQSSRSMPECAGPAGVKPALAAKRRTRPVVENHDYAAFAHRVIRAQGRRIAAGDIEELAYLFGLQRELHQAIHTPPSPDYAPRATAAPTSPCA